VAVKDRLENVEMAGGDAADDRPVVGVLGGMGPAATADFFQKLVVATPAENDQDHLRVLIWSDPLVPDRTAALLGDGPDPTAWMIRGARLLVAGGVDLIAVPCNTAHAFLDAVEGEVGVEIVHMIDRTARVVAALTPTVRRIGLLATPGTVRARLYDDWLSRYGIGVVAPDERDQVVVAEVIARVKAGRWRRSDAAAIAEVGQRLVDRGAQALIAGCTEIPLIFGAANTTVPVIDPTLALADAVVAAAGGRRTRPTARRPA
jgi:aspartate racemase